MSTKVKKNYPVLNMSCASCASSSQNILNQQEGVLEATVNYANEQAEILFDPAVTSPQKLKEALQAIGFDLMIDESAEAQENLEKIQQSNYKKLKKKTTFAIIFAIPLTIIGMIFMNMPYANYIMWILSTPIVFYFGQQFFVGAWKQLKNKTANMDTLVALSTSIAYLFSVFNTLFPSFWLQKGLEPHVYFETAGVVITFILLGKVLEENAKGNTSSALKKLIGMQPKTVNKIDNSGNPVEVSVSSIQIGDIILVKPGEKIAVDGIVTSGSSFVDESMISGESMPVEKQSSNYVYAGTINQKGNFQFRATKVGGETLLAQIIQMVQSAQGSKAPVQKLVDKIASIFVPIVILISILAFISWNILGAQNGFTYGLLAMVTVLVIACPCALGLATPTAIMVGIGKGAENGILIKNAESLELAKKIDVIVLDKTGTITEGNPIVNQLHWLDQSNAELESILYSIEKSSEHPLAEAIVQHLENSKIKHFNVQIENVSGKGIIGKLNGENYFVGNPQFIAQQNIEIDSTTNQLIQQELDKAQTVVLMANSNQVLGIIAISDQVKVNSPKAIRELQNLGIEVYMQTGDNHQTAKAIAQQVGIKKFQAEVLPADKLNFVKELQSQGKTVAMVGDGINDSAALAQSNVGIAMGKGSDIAIESSQMTILSNDLIKIPQAIQLSKQTVSTIKQNLFWAFIYNLIGIPIAAGVLFPINGFLLDPMFAGAAMALSSVSVVSNSLRLKWKKL